MRRLFQSSTNIVISILVIAIVEYYCYAAMKTAIRHLGRPWRRLVRIMYIVLNVLFWIAMLTMPKYMNGTGVEWVDKYLVVMAMGGVFGKLIVTIIMLLTDAVLVIKRLVRSRSALKEIEESTDKQPFIRRSVVASVVALVAGGLVAFSFLYGTRNKYNYNVKHVVLEHDKVPEGFDGMKIAQITDIHSGSLDNPDRVMQGINMIMAEQPDMIVFTGDIVNYIQDELVPYVPVFSNLSAPMGVFAILGNHDYGDYYKWEREEDKQQNLENLKALFPRMGWELLLNENVIFDKYGDRLAVIGVENWSAHSSFPQYGILQQAIDSLDEKGSEFNILLSHDPSHWEAEVLDAPVDIHLTLSGHTHGMQFGIDINGFKWSPIEYVYEEWMGLYQKGEKYLYVNPGFGFIGYKGRVGILPEITIIELKRKR